MARTSLAVLLWSALSASSLAAAVPAAHPMITPAPVLKPRDLERRGLDVGSYLNSVFSSLGSDVSSFVASGVPQFFNDLPTGTAVESSLGITASDLSASPTQALLVPPYANWTDQGWNVRVHGNIYKQPNISTDKLNSLANGFLIGTNIQDLPQDQQDQARNLTSEIYIVQQDNEQVKVDFVTNVAVNPGTDSGAINAAGGAQTITMPDNTTAEGDFDRFVVLQNVTGANGGHLLHSRSFIYQTYPFGSFDTRPLNFSDVSATLSIRKFLLDKVFQTFPQRKFILVADTSNSDVMSDYPQLATDYPGQVQCIFLKNSSSAEKTANANTTDSDDPFPYNTKGFQGLNASTYFFFNNADDLMGLDIVNGQCVNASIAQNVTFGEQNLPFGAAGVVVPPGWWRTLGMGLGAVLMIAAMS